MLVQLGLKLDAPTRIKGYSRTTKKFYMAATAFVCLVFLCEGFANFAQKMPPKVLFVKISPTSKKAESTILLQVGSSRPFLISPLIVDLEEG